jgi:hypothetical protein
MKKALIAVLLLLVSIGAGWFWWSGRDARDAKDELPCMATWTSGRYRWRLKEAAA